MKNFFKRFYKNFSKEKFKEFSLVLFAFILVGIGYINFANTDIKVAETYAKTTNNLGDVELVSGNVVQEDALVDNELNNEIDISEKQDIKDSDSIEEKDIKEIDDIEEQYLEENKVEENEEVINFENDKDKYFTEVRLNRDIMYDEILETYQTIVDNVNISSEQKSIAIQEIDKLAKQKKSISVAEELIKLKGFENVVILVNNDNVNVVIRIAVLSKEQVVQIQNIVTKELQVDISNISISTK